MWWSGMRLKFHCFVCNNSIFPCARKCRLFKAHITAIFATSTCRRSLRHIHLVSMVSILSSTQQEFLPTTGEGNVFTGVCLSKAGQGVEGKLEGKGEWRGAVGIWIRWTYPLPVRSGPGKGMEGRGGHPDQVSYPSPLRARFVIGVVVSIASLC